MTSVVSQFPHPGCQRTPSSHHRVRHLLFQTSTFHFGANQHPTKIELATRCDLAMRFGRRKMMFENFEHCEPDWRTALQSSVRVESLDVFSNQLNVELLCCLVLLICFFSGFILAFCCEFEPNLFVHVHCTDDKLKRPSGFASRSVRMKAGFSCIQSLGQFYRRVGMFYLYTYGMFE